MYESTFEGSVFDFCIESGKILSVEDIAKQFNTTQEKSRYALNRVIKRLKKRPLLATKVGLKTAIDAYVEDLEANTSMVILSAVSRLEHGPITYEANIKMFRDGDILLEKRSQTDDWHLNRKYTYKVYTNAGGRYQGQWLQFDASTALGASRKLISLNLPGFKIVKSVRPWRGEVEFENNSKANLLIK